MTERPTEVIAEQRKTELINRGTEVVRSDQRAAPYAPRISRVGSILGGTKGKYELLEELQVRGGEATLFLCKRYGSTDKVRFVAKVYAMQARVVDGKRRSRLIEFLSQTDARTSHIMPLLDYGMVDEAFFDVLPYYSEGDLSKKGKFSYEQLKDVIIPAVNASLKEIHGHGFIHRDLKPSNLYLDNGRVIIGDFGITSMYEDETDMGYTRHMGGTPGYVAAEVGQGIAHTKSDYYALGMTLASLYKGSDIWQGLSELAIYMSMIKKELPVEFAEKDKRLRDLIRGLITNDVERRFGYEDVHKWCKGEQVAVREGGYTFGDNEATDDVVLLAERFASSWDKGIQHLYYPGGPVQEYFKTINQEFAVRVREIVSTECKDNRDLGLFRFVYLLNNKTFLCWRGVKYDSLMAVAVRIREALPNVLPDVSDMIKSKATSWRFEQPKVLSPDEKELLAAIRKVEAWSASAPEIAYYLFMYRFLPQAVERNYMLDEQAFASLDALFKALATDSGTLYDTCDRLVKCDRFYAFAISQGFEAAATRLRGRKGGTFRDRLKSVLIFFEECSHDKSTVRDAYLKFGPSAHLYWLKKNLHLYGFNGAAATKLKADIVKLKVDTTMSLVEIDKCLLQLEDMKNEFMGLFKSNLLLALAGISDGADSDGITTGSSDGYFLCDFMGRQAPAGFGRGITQQNVLSICNNNDTATATVVSGKGAVPR